MTRARWSKPAPRALAPVLESRLRRKPPASKATDAVRWHTNYGSTGYVDLLEIANCKLETENCKSALRVSCRIRALSPKTQGQFSIFSFQFSVCSVLFL